MDDGIAFLAAPNLKGSAIDWSGANYITKQRYDESPEIALQKDDILLVKDGSIGIVAVVRSLPRPTTVNGSIAVIRPRGVNSEFLALWLESTPMQEHMARMQDGMGVPHLFQRDIRKFRLPMPDYGTQEALAAYTRRETARTDALIAQKERLLALLEEKRQALIGHAVTKGLDPKKPMKDSGHWWIGLMPVDWQVLKVKNVASVESGHTPSKTVPEYWENCTIPWVSLQDSGYLRSHDYITETAQNISELGMANSSAHLLPADAVVFSRDATVGLCVITTRPMAVSQHFIAWICGERILPKYLLYVLHAMKPELDRLTMGSTIVTIGMPEIRNLSCPLPSLDEQRAIVAGIDTARSRLARLVALTRQSISLLGERRQALITAAVTGQLDPSTYMPKQEVVAA